MQPPQVIWESQDDADPIRDFRGAQDAMLRNSEMPKPYVLPLVFMFPSRTIFVEVADVLAFQQELKESVHEEGLKGISHIGLAVRYLRSGRPWRTWEQYITSFAPPG